jgi:outer membrane protein assembly factor BamA
MNPLANGALPCAMLLCASAASAADTASTRVPQMAMLAPRGSDAASPVLTDRELQERGARIGRIHILVDEVFEESLSLSAPYRLVNTLHVATREQTVSQQLLFRQGDTFNRRVLDETARLLREQRYLSDASIETASYNTDNTVDVIVRVHDVWTLSPGLSFGRKGGENSSKVKFEDTNFLGLGKQISLSRSQDVDRTAWRLGYVDPHVLGSWWRLAAAHSSLSDGSDDEFSIGRPFYSLDSRWSAELSATDADTTTARYSLGKQVGQFDMQSQTLSLAGGISEGLHDGWTQRYLYGVRYDNRSFATNRADPAALLPEDRRYTYPYVGVQWIEDAYIRTRNLDQIGRVEDLHLGRSLLLTAGWASSALGSSRNALMLSGSGAAGVELTDKQYLIGSFGFDSRVEGGGVRNGKLDLGSRYYLRQSEHRVLFGALEATWTSHLDAETQLLLGGDNGLRGYPLRYQAGSSRAMLTLEQRFYTDWQPLKIANVGAAIFADAGRTWGHDAFAKAPAGWLTDVGLGLRLGSARSGLGNVLHIDLAFPLDRTSDIDGTQVSIETKRSF